jgi:hypothetical protein
MSSMPKGESNLHIISWTFANRVVEKRNMINDYLRGRVCIEFIRGDLIQGSFWILSFSCSFPWFAAFRTSCWSCGFSLFYMTFLSFFWLFWSCSCASWGFEFKLQTLCFLLSTDSSRGRLINQMVNSLVWLWWVIDLAMFEFESGTFRWFYYLYLVRENDVCLSRGVHVAGVT